MSVEALGVAAAIIAGHGGTAWAVGGCVRSLLLGQAAADVDIAVGGAGAEGATDLAFTATVARQIAHRLGGAHVFTLDPDMGVARITHGSTQLDLAALHRNDLAADLARRDFTINALALPLARYADCIEMGTQPDPAEVVDRTGGVADIAIKRIRMVAEQNLIDDPLRMLRAVRQRAQLRGFDLTPDTADAIRRNAGLIVQSAAERVHEEWGKLALAGYVAPSLRLLDDLGLLTRLILELDATRGITQGGWHYWDVFNHSINAVARLEWLLTGTTGDPDLDAELANVARPEPIIVHWPIFQKALRGERLSDLYMVTLLHDIAKPATRQINEAGRVIFYNHDSVGAEMVRAILARLRFGNSSIRHAAILVGNHLRAGMLAMDYDPTTHEGLSGRAIYRYLKAVEDVPAEALLLSLADHAAVNGPTLGVGDHAWQWWRHLVFTDVLARKFYDPDDAQAHPPKLVDGGDLMRELALSPGPLIGRLLDAIQDAQADGIVRTRADALELANDLAKKLAKGGGDV